MKNSFLFLNALIYFIVMGCSNQAIQMTLKINTPGFSATNIPVETAINLPAEFENMNSDGLVVRLTSELGVEVPGQIQKDKNGEATLIFINPDIQKGISQRWSLRIYEGTSNQTVFEWQDNPGQYFDLSYGGKKITKYVYTYDNSSPEKLEATNKPFHHVYDADGKDFITNGPEGLYPHHRGLFIGWQKVTCGNQEYNFWSMENGAYQGHQRIFDKSNGPVLASSAAEIFWMDENNAPVIKEIRRTSVYNQPDPTVMLMKFETAITPVKCDVNLMGNAEHAGFQFRAHSDVAEGYIQGQHGDVSEDKVKAQYYFDRENIDPRKDLDLPWTALSYYLRENQYSVLHINHPQNPQNTIYSAYRNYGRFGTSFNTSVNKGDSLQLIYYIWVVKGEVPDRNIFDSKYKGLTQKLNLDFVQ